jgi:hypothetical protein
MGGHGRNPPFLAGARTPRRFPYHARLAGGPVGVWGGRRPGLRWNGSLFGLTFLSRAPAGLDKPGGHTSMSAFTL